jgi:hypothetical protein
MCRLKSLLPPKVGIDWVCGDNLFNNDDSFEDI